MNINGMRSPTRIWGNFLSCLAISRMNFWYFSSPTFLTVNIHEEAGCKMWSVETTTYLHQRQLVLQRSTTIHEQNFSVINENKKNMTSTYCLGGAIAIWEVIDLDLNDLFLSRGPLDTICFGEPLWNLGDCCSVRNPEECADFARDGQSLFGKGSVAPFLDGLRSCFDFRPVHRTNKAIRFWWLT